MPLESFKEDMGMREKDKEFASQTTFPPKRGTMGFQTLRLSRNMDDGGL